MAVEIDERFEDDLSLLAEQHNNLEVIHDNALDFLTPWRFIELMSRQESENWVAGNIPYHVTEALN